MLRQISPRLGRIDVVFNSFSGCIANTSKELAWAPKMSLGEIFSQPRMLLQNSKGRISFEQLQCLADTHCWRQLNKEMNMVNSDVKFVDFTSIFDSNFMDEPFAINPDSEKFERVHRIFWLPDKVESILPEGMVKRLQIHFFPPESAVRNKAHANSKLVCREGNISPLCNNQLFQEDKFMEGRIPPMFESMGTLRQM